MIRFLLISTLTILSAAVTLAQTEKATPAPTATPLKAQSAEMATPAANPADVHSSTRSSLRFTT